MNALAFNYKISNNRDFSAIVRNKKKSLVEEAKSWTGSTIQGIFIFHEIWISRDERFKVALGKYGKEYYLNTISWKDGHKANNPNDMRPTMFENNKEINFEGSFDHVFHYFQEAYKIDEEALRLLGCLLFRNAYLADHVKVDGKWAYNPPMEIVSLLDKRLGNIEGVNVEMFLHYLEAIALNEDTKYDSIGFDINSGIGRKNNLLTYAHIIAVLLGESSLAKLCSSFSRPPAGVSPITNIDAKKAFPQLNIE